MVHPRWACSFLGVTEKRTTNYKGMGVLVGGGVQEEEHSGEAPQGASECKSHWRFLEMHNPRLREMHMRRPRAEVGRGLFGGPQCILCLSLEHQGHAERWGGTGDDTFERPWLHAEAVISKVLLSHGNDF